MELKQGNGWFCLFCFMVEVDYEVLNNKFDNTTTQCYDC